MAASVEKQVRFEVDNHKTKVESDDEPTLGELVEVVKRERTADIHEREDEALNARNGFFPRRMEWAPQTVGKRGKKSKPREISSRRPVPLGRDRCLGIEDASDRMRSVRNFDPRFEEHCGDLREEHVERNYHFVNGMRQKDMQQLRDTVQNDESNQAAARELTRLEQDETRRRTAARRNDILKNLRREEKEAVKRGKNPYFLKEKDIRRVEMEAKFDDMKKRGGVTKYIEKRRRKIASKDRKLLPQRRRDSMN